jgi:hypothetical protein
MGNHGATFPVLSLPLSGRDTARNAVSRAAGSVFPRFSARRSIPAHAVELKKYRCGIEPASSTCDNEHALASLGQSEMLGVKHPPRDCSRGSKHSTSVRPPAPWRLERHVLAGKASKETTEGVVGGAEDSWHVLPEDDAGPLASSNSNSINCICDLHKGQAEVATRIVKRPSHTGD